MADVRLLNPLMRISSRLAFYEGSLPTVDGVVTIPHGRTSWAGSAFQRGFKFDPETGQALGYSEIIRRVKTVAGPVEVDDASDVADEPVEAVPEPLAETEVAKPKVVRKTKRKKRVTK